jgi:glycerophosphoryl diester phosphodiesterase
MIRFLLLALLTQSALAVDWQGHRGSRGLYPENTIGAMEEALKYPVTTLEFDVVISKDNKIIVSHEPWMSDEICLDPKGKPVKGRDNNIYKLTYDEIAKFDCGSKPHPRFPQQQKISVGKPTLEKLLETTEPLLKSLHRANIGYNIEIKSLPEDEKDGFQPDVKTFSDSVVRTLKGLLPESKFTIQSFDWRVLKYIHTTYPDVRLVALLEGPINVAEILKNLGFKPYVFSPYFKDLKQEHVDEFHKQGVKVVVWTVNDVADMEVLLKMKVDGIITDYPNLIADAVAKHCKQGSNIFEGRCVKVPTHAVPSLDNPGWDCKPGYVQKRSSCISIKVPTNGQLTPDGKNWECNPGFERYRSSCKKI